MLQTPEFLHNVSFDDIPAAAVHQARLCLLDLIGVAAAGRKTDLSAIAHRHATRYIASGDGLGVRLLFDGRRASPEGAAFAGAATIDSIDGHDGHRLTKGHAGAAVLPALLAYVDDNGPVTGREFLTCLVLGYEIGTRAGMALHASAGDYHTSGAWNALACAAIGARLMGLDTQRTRHALGIAEYHGPRSPMMRCIEHPTMVKDGSAYGALSGVTAAHLAADGFTGAPAVTVEDSEHASLWRDLGRRWRITEQYLKPYPVCRWAQPAIQAALVLQRKNRVNPNAIQCVRVHTFRQATQLAVRAPSTTEQAQYSTPFPVAAALMAGELGAEQITGIGLQDPQTLRLARDVELIEDPALDALFPDERWARVDLLVDDVWLKGTAQTAPGDPENALDATQIARKFYNLATPILGKARCKLIEKSVASIVDDGDALDTLLRNLFAPV